MYKATLFMVLCPFGLMHYWLKARLSSFTTTVWREQSSLSMANNQQGVDNLISSLLCSKSRTSCKKSEKSISSLDCSIIILITDFFDFAILFLSPEPSYTPPLPPQIFFEIY